MNESDVAATIATTTGPIGTVLAIGFVWLRGEFRDIRKDGKATSEGVKRNSVRLDVLEAEE